MHACMQQQQQQQHKTTLNLRNLMIESFADFPNPSCKSASANEAAAPLQRPAMSSSEFLRSSCTAATLDALTDSGRLLHLPITMSPQTSPLPSGGIVAALCFPSHNEHGTAPMLCCGCMRPPQHHMTLHCSILRRRPSRGQRVHRAAWSRDSRHQSTKLLRRRRCCCHHHRHDG
jgi:hypothetical protein